jgi:hypothetical protein
MENLTPVTLVVKAANQKIADQTVECALDWTVKKLKQHLATVYPSKPVETQQRIIYSGQLLQDHLTLKDVLRQYEPNQTVHTVHLVCSPTETSGNCANTSSRDPELRHRHVTTTHSAPNIDMPPVVQPGTNYSPEQMYWIQHTYAQYMAHYMHYYQSTLYPQTYPAGPFAAVNPLGANVDVFNIPDDRMPLGAAQGAGAAPQAGPEIVRMNAQGGPVADDDDDEMQERDWLDWTYVLLRFAILLCILYFYSSLGRIIATVALIICIYMFQVGWFQIQRGNQQRRQQTPPANQQDVTNEDAPQTPEDAEPQPSCLMVVWTFVVSFFASLVPHHPAPPVNVN